LTSYRRSCLPDNDKDPGGYEPVTDPSRAVFLSYASQDADAARRIRDALSAGGIQVWFDQSELRGGDAWDRQIHRQIRDCLLFVPIISANTQARLEGYFRREWKLAVDRTHDMAEAKPFLVPVVVDSTSEQVAEVPDAFRAVQWTRLLAGETPAAFLERIQRLLSGDSGTARARPVGLTGAGLPQTPPGPLHLRRSRFLYGGGIAAALLVLGYFGFKRPDGAVLPLANESAEAGQQYFSDGISEDLITALSQLSGLKVIGRTSAFQFRDSKDDSRSIGAKLGVAHLLEGSVRRSGDMVRVSAQLIDTADGSTQWSARYDRPYKDLFALQDEITRAVAGELRAQLLPGDTKLSERPPSGSLDAYNAVLQGRFYSLRNTEADHRKAIEYFTQAITIDPRYATAWSALSREWSGLAGTFLEGAPAQEAYGRAREAANRALAASPGLAEAHIARGDVLSYADFDWRGAEAEYRRALALAPNDAEAISNVGGALALYGELGPAVDLTRQALAIEPLQPQRYFWLANYLTGLNRLDDAELAIHRAIELQPTSAGFHEQLAIIEILRGRAQPALVEAQQEPAGWWQDTAVALARQIGTDRGAADAALRTVIERDAGAAAYQIAQVYALRNDAKATFEWLDRAWSNRDPGIQFLLSDPFILRFKNDPRFAAFCRKVGLPGPGESPAGAAS
jgi:TolB-like protein/Flp pilus assembly protein TadD